MLSTFERCYVDIDIKALSASDQNFIQVGLKVIYNVFSSMCFGSDELHHAFDEDFEDILECFFGKPIQVIVEQFSTPDTLIRFLYEHEADFTVALDNFFSIEECEGLVDSLYFKYDKSLSSLNQSGSYYFPCDDRADLLYLVRDFEHKINHHPALKHWQYLICHACYQYLQGITDLKHFQRHINEHISYDDFGQDLLYISGSQVVCAYRDASIITVLQDHDDNYRMQTGESFGVAFLCQPDQPDYFFAFHYLRGVLTSEALLNHLTLALN